MRFVRQLILFLLPSILLAGKPKLVNVIVIDMFPVEYLERFDDLFGAGGFHRFEQDGVWYQNAAYGYGATLTGPGHATISTGRNPREHGIVLNDWYDRERKQTVYCVGDSTATVSGGRSSGASPKNLRGEGMADLFEHVSDGKAKTVSLSLKDRAAVLMGGRKPDRVFWFGEDGAFVTSDYYDKELPLWVYAFNCEKVADSYIKRVWERALPLAAYERCSIDNAPWETGPEAKLSNILPKIIGDSSAAPDANYYTALACSPFGNEMLLELARRAVIAEQMGDDSICDFLSVSLSSNDEAGHLFGPNSHEMLDFTVRTDRQLANWLDFLDNRVGLDNCLIVLTGDHGVAEAPETSCGAGEDCGRFKSRDLQNSMNAELNKFYGTSADSLRFVERIQLPWVYVAEELAPEHGINLDELFQRVGVVMKSHPAVSEVFYTYPGCPRADDQRMEAIVNGGFYPDRCGQIYVHLKPHWLPTKSCTTHGTAQDYDRRVPLFFLGAEVSPQRVGRPVEIRDISVTVGGKAGLAPSAGSTGTALSEVGTR
jgi:hypothetical protein